MSCMLAWMHGVRNEGTASITHKEDILHVSMACQKLCMGERRHAWQDKSAIRWEGDTLMCSKALRLVC